jgi:hypothetical protein
VEGAAHVGAPQVPVPVGVLPRGRSFRLPKEKPITPVMLFHDEPAVKPAGG